MGQPQSLIHCTGAYTDELPAPGFDSQRPRAKDLWTMGMAQIFASVSPAMHQTFELDYASRWYDRFGLVYYGCCEPLDAKLHIVRAIPNLRKIPMSPWVNVDRVPSASGATLSSRESPVLLSWRATLSTRTPFADLEQTRDACERHNTPVEFILKDISTVRYQPQRLWEWADIAMDVIRR